MGDEAVAHICYHCCGLNEGRRLLSTGSCAGIASERFLGCAVLEAKGNDMTRNSAEWATPPSVADTHFIDNSIYTDAEIYREEQEKIFSKVWKFCVHESEMPKIGDYRALSVAGKPVFLVRGDDKTIRGFYNVCPHRGAEIVRRPAGNEKNFTCLFHHWSFDRQGECVSITMPKGYEESGLDAKDCGLREVKTDTKFGFVFVNLDDNAVSLDDWIGDSWDLVADPIGTEELEVFHYHQAIVPGNWKNWMETDRELYHEFLHVVNRTTSFLGEGYLDRGVEVYANGHMAAEPGFMAYDKYDESRRKERSNPLPGLASNEFRLANLYPDMMVNIRATVIRLDSLTPLSPTETLAEYRGVGLKSDSPEIRDMRIKDHNEYWGPFGRNLAEDTVAVAEQMKAMRGGGSPFSIMAREKDSPPAHNDEPVRHFYRLWEEMMGRKAHNPHNNPRIRAVA